MNLKEKRMEANKKNEMNLSFIVKSLLHHWYILLIAVLVCSMGMLGVSRFMVAPKYSSTVKMYVNNGSTLINDYVSSSELLVAKELVNTYVAILETPDTLVRVIEESGLDYSLSQLSSMIRAGSVNNTEVFYITVVAPDAKHAAILADTISKVLPERISEVVDKSSVSVVQKAIVPTAPSSPNHMNYVLIGALIGLCLSCAAVLLKEFLDNAIHDEQYPTETYSMRTLGYIPSLGEKKEKKASKSGEMAIENTVICKELPFGAAEAYKTLRTNLKNLSDKGQSYKVLGITSPCPGDGKSTMAINLAYTVAQTGKSVVLIEADMRKPVMAKRLNLKARAGLKDMLMEPGTNAIQESGYMENWKVISAGTATENPAELLGSRAFDQLIDRLCGEYDYVLIDLPPVNEVSDAMTVSRCLDGMICTIKQSYTRKMDLAVAMRHMSYSNTEIIGFVINNASSGGKYGYKGYKYGYKYSYKQ